jgi:ribonuclease Z
MCIMIKLTFLGTSAGAPTTRRNVTAIAVQLPQRGDAWLFDCGEATQHQVLRLPLRLSQFQTIFLTHLHGDHVFGLPGLLASRSMQSGSETPVTLYGPRGLAEFVKASLDYSGSQLKYPLDVQIVTEGKIYEDDRFEVWAKPLKHRIPCFGYAIVEKEQAGTFDVEQAQALGIPPGPVYGRLKAGKTVTLDDGREIHGADLVGAPRPGRKVVICGDTIFTPNAVDLARDADLLVHEATHLQEDLALAERAFHSTSVMAAETAKQANANRLILTHFSARYEGEQGRMDELLQEARTVFPNTDLARDFLVVEVPARQANPEPPQ